MKKNKKTLKGSTGISLKLAGISSLAVFAVLFIIRLYQTFALTDGATGFFTNDNFSVMLMYILFGAGIVLSLVFCYLCSNLPGGEMKSKKSMLYFVSNLLLALALFYDAYKKLSVFLGAEGEFAVKKEAVGGNIGFVSLVFGFLGGLSLVAAALLYFKDSKLLKKISIPMLFPVIWAFVETLSFFSITVSYVKVSQLLLTIFFAAFFMVFLFENARITVGIGRKDSLWFFFATGFITVGLSLAAGVPAFIASIVSPEKLVSYCPFEFYVLAGGLYALSAMLIRDKFIETEENADKKEEKTDDVTETE